MPLALDRPSYHGLFTELLGHWTLQPIAVALSLALGGWYVWAARRVDGGWSRGRTVTFFGGLVVLLWLSCGWPQVYADSVYWIWTSQTLALWLLVPALVMFGHPVQLARAVHGERVERALRSAPMRVLGSPLLGPALVPALSFALFFGPFPGWCSRWEIVAWLAHLGLLLVGTVMMIPLVGLEEEASSLAVGFALAIGSFELVLDAVPGIALRLHNTLVSTYFDHRTQQPWSPRPLHDQQIAGGILWCIAELIDLPFLVLVYQRWLRADARDAARVDAVLAAERAARRGLTPDRVTPSPALPAGEHDLSEEELAERVERDVPWWLSDSRMQQQIRRLR